MKKVIRSIKNSGRSILNDFFLKKMRRLDIFKRLIIAFLAVIIIPNTIVGLVSLSEFTSELNQIIARNSYKTLYSLDAAIKERLERYEDYANNLCKNEELKKMLQLSESMKTVTSLSDLQQSDYDDYKSKIGQILYTTSNYSSGIKNIEIVSSNDEFTQLNYLNEPAGGAIADIQNFRKSQFYQRAIEAYNIPIWWDTSQERSTFYSITHPSTHLGNYITMLKAIPNSGMKEPLGVIVINISIEAMSGMFTFQDQYLQGGDLLLLSSRGIIHYFSPSPYFTKLSNETIQRLISLNTESISKKIAGKDYLISAVKSEITGWTLCSVIPRKSLLERAFAIKNLIIQLSLICIGLAIFLSYVVTLSISRPIKSLKLAMEKVDETNIEITHIDGMKDEVGILGQKFNSMIKRIQNLINSVYEAEIIRKEEMLHRKEAEFNALQMQINPHFLYNTLDIIRWQIIAEKNGESKASKMISSFAQLLRMGTSCSNYLVPISEEIEHIKAYIDVVQFDLEYELHISYLINEDLLNYKIPKFTLQPLIENVIVHGFAHKQDDAEIIIRAYTKNDLIYIEVTDNGEGIPSDTLNTINETLGRAKGKSNSIGIKNVNERIKLYFGDQYGLEIKSSLGKATTAIINIPVTKSDVLFQTGMLK